MSERFIQTQLHADEQILAIVRRSPLAHAFLWLSAVTVIIASFFFLFPLLRQGKWGLFGFLTLFALGIFLLVRAVLFTRFNIVALTTERLIDIDQKGIFHRIVSECGYASIDETSYDIRGFLGTMFDVGTLHIHTSGSRADLAIKGIKHPQHVQEVIGKIQKKITAKSSETMSASDLVRTIDAIRSQIDLPGLKEKKNTERDQGKKLYGKS